MLLLCLFIYKLLRPSAWNFLLSFESNSLEGAFNMQLEAKVNEYLDTIFLIYLLTNLLFQSRIILLILLRSNIINYDGLIKYRKVFILINFILAALCSPPDVFSQVLLALPLIIFYEGIILFTFLKEAYKSK